MEDGREGPGSVRSDWRSGLEWVRMRVLVLQMQDIQSPGATPACKPAQCAACSGTGARGIPPAPSVPGIIIGIDFLLCVFTRLSPYKIGERWFVLLQRLFPIYQKILIDYHRPYRIIAPIVAHRRRHHPPLRPTISETHVQS